MVIYSDHDTRYHLFLRLLSQYNTSFRYKGFQVAPAELEGVICSHPSVQDATVIPRADEEAGELPRAYIVLRPGIEADDSVATDIQVVKQYMNTL